jgi:hypothetical protein
MSDCNPSLNSSSSSSISTRIRSVPDDGNRNRWKVCILNESDARSLIYAGIEHKCNSRRHHHYTKSKVEALVKTGELIWLGKHRKLATYRNARSWMKVYSKNSFGEVVSCGMQLVRGGGGF